MAAQSSSNPDINFKRFLYICSESLHFISGDPIYHKHLKLDNTISIPLILSGDNPKKLLNIIELVNSENIAPHRFTLFFALAAAAININDNLRHEVANTVLGITKDVKDLFDFLKFTIDIKGKRQLGASTRRIFSTYYKSLDPMEFAKMVTRNNGYHGFKHKDIFKLVHPKSDNFLWGLVAVYIMYGLKEARTKAGENPEAAELLNYLTQVETLKRTEDETKAAELIKENHFNLNQVPTILHKSKIVWEALIPQFIVGDLLNHLPRINKHGFLKQVSTFSNLIIEKLSNAEIVAASKIHPIQVFIAMKNLEKGGRKIDPKHLKYLESKEQEKLEADSSYVKQDFSIVHVPKCPQITSAVQKTLELSYKNLETTGKRVVICVQQYNEVMESSCLTTSNVTCIEAAAILILCYLKAEQNVTVAIFNGNDIKIVNITEKTFRAVIQKLKQTKGDFLLPCKAIDWATRQKKKIDLFINIFSCPKPIFEAPKEHKKREDCFEMLNNYKRKISMPNTKVVNMSLGNHRLVLGGSNCGILDIGGFDANTPNVIRAFSTDLFA